MNIFLAKRYVAYIVLSWHRYGHGIHSPFVYRLVREVFNDGVEPVWVEGISALRKSLVRSSDIVELSDRGAGSSVMRSRMRSIGDIARHSTMPDRYGFLLARLAARFKPRTVLELGTCLGVGTCWLQKGCEDALVYTIEAEDSLCRIARLSLDRVGVTGVTIINGTFEEELPRLLGTMDTVDLVFFDGNHRYEPTIDYFEQCLARAHEGSVFVFDDIYWSEGMAKAWGYVKMHPRVRLTVDLFRFGIVFFNEGVAKQDFVVRY